MLHQKKVAEMKIKEDPSKRDLYQMKIDELNKNAIGKLKEMEDYAMKHKQRGAVVFAEFKSMNGKQKFLKAFKVSTCRRCIMSCSGLFGKISHK